MADDNARHDDPAPKLHLPDARPGCWRVTRSAGLRWLVCLVSINLVCFFVAMDVHGAGFDDCELMPTSSERRTMELIALVALVAPSVLALRMLRGRARLAALGTAVMCGAALFLLVRGSQDCGLT